MTIVTGWEFGKTLYLVTDVDQRKRQFIGIITRMSGTQYELSCGTASSWHWEFEISEEPSILAKMEINGA